MNSNFKKRMTNDWIRENLFQTGEVFLDAYVNFIGDNHHLGQALQIFERMFPEVEYHLGKDCFGTWTQTGVNYSGVAYSGNFQIDWDFNDLKNWGLPETKSALVFATIIQYMEEKE